MLWGRAIRKQAISLSRTLDLEHVPCETGELPSPNDTRTWEVVASFAQVYIREQTGW